MVATVKKNGTPIWYLMATDEGHGFRKKSNADFNSMQRSLLSVSFCSLDWTGYFIGRGATETV